LEIGDFNGLGQFVLKNSKIFAQPEINSFLSEAAYAQRAGKEALAQKYVHHAVFLQRCNKCRPEDLESLFQWLAARGETAKDLFADVTKAYNAIKSKHPAPVPRGEEGVTQSAPTTTHVRDRARYPESQTTQGPKQSEVIPHQSIDRVNKLPTQPQPTQTKGRDGRSVYFDNQGRSVRPAAARQEHQRARHEVELEPPTQKMANMKVVEARDSSGNEAPAQTKGKDPPRTNLTTEKGIERPIGPQGGANQRRQESTIKGTAGDWEALDAGKPAQYTEERTKPRRLHEAAKTRGLFHAGQGKLSIPLLLPLKASYLT
jgi:hypothetical protein